jgi:hypothetical protein
VGKPQEKRPFGRPKRRLVDDIKWMLLVRETEWDGME